MIIEIKFENDDIKKYGVKAIHNSKVYAKKLDSDYLSSFYYLVL